MNRADHVVRCDVLVIGGGIAGCLAAITAKQELGDKGSVVIVNKGYLSRSGQTPWAAGGFFVFDPDTDDMQVWLEDMIKAGEYLNDQYWCRQMLEQSHRIATKIDDWANKMCFVRDEKGNMLQHTGRGHERTRHRLFAALPTMDALRRRLLQEGVTILDRVMVTDLLKDDSRAIGALGLDYQQSTIYLFLAKAIILAASGCSFKNLYLSVQPLTGDVQAAAYEIGIEFAGMENVFSNTCWKDYDVRGMGRFQTLGGKFINRLGEEFMWDYDPILGNRTRLPVLCMSISQEVAAGRGPVYLDLRETTQENRDLFRKLLPDVFKTFERAGRSPFTEPMEWAPAIVGTTGAGGGIFLDNLDCKTNVPGVFAAGDICWQPVQGTYTFSGVNICFSAVSGEISARSAARSVLNGSIETPRQPSKRLISEMLGSRLAPLGRQNGLDPEEVIHEIRKVILPYNIALIKTGSRLSKALERVKHIQTEILPCLKACSAHELVKALEARSMSIIAELILRASLFREESRGFHFREEFPYSDNENWLKQVVLKRAGDSEVLIRTHPVATPFVKPETSKSPPRGVKKSC